MENRSLSLAAGLIVLLALAPPLVAGEATDPALQQDWQQRLAKAAALQAEGRQRQAEAERVLAEKNAECASRFLVNSCRNGNQEEYMLAARQARQLQNEGDVIERQVKKEQMSERDRQFRADAPKRAADLQARQAETEAARSETEARTASLIADKEKKAEAGAKRKAAAAEEHQRKVREHEARVAAKMKQAAERSAAEKK